MEIWQMVAIALLGLIAGIGGGLLGIGGSLIMIPGLVLLFGQTEHEYFNQHVYQAGAMIANVAVSVPAAWRHYRRGATVISALKFMIPAALVAVLLGVWMSNLPLFRGPEGGVWLGRILAVFLVYVIGLNIVRLIRGEGSSEPSGAMRVSLVPAAGVGTVLGGTAGLLGIGGGVFAVPLQQVLMRMPLRPAIANASAVICLSATVGAFVKNATLGQHGFHWEHSLLLAAMLAPTCWIGGLLGATLCHTLPLRYVRIAFVVILSAATYRMLDV